MHCMPMLRHEFEHERSNRQHRFISWLINLEARQQSEMVSPKKSLAEKTEVNREIYTTTGIL